MNALMLLQLLPMVFALANGQFYNPVLGEVKASTSGEYPWTAAIFWTRDKEVGFCGGVLLNTEWVLTAGQCTDRMREFRVILGATQFNKNSINVTKIITNIYYLHPQFNRNSLENDLGLIKFHRPIQYTENINRVYLPYQEIMDAGSLAVANSWNQNQNYNLYEIQVAALSNSECGILYRKTIAKNVLCVSGNCNKELCVGNVGGALTQHISRGYAIVVAIASFMESNSSDYYPARFTRVFGYNNWIRSVVRSDI